MKGVYSNAAISECDKQFLIGIDPSTHARVEDALFNIQSTYLSWTAN